jgi:hypothetical protein
MNWKEAILGRTTAGRVAMALFLALIITIIISLLK